MRPAIAALVLSPRDPMDRLAAYARLGDAPLPLLAAGLAFAELDRPAIPLDEALTVIAQMERALAMVATPDMPLDQRIRALRRVLGQEQGFRGDRETYDDPANADLYQVIIRRKGLPVALGILSIHLARAVGWQAVGLNFPGHFLIRLDAEGRRAIIDPFNDWDAKDAAGLRRLLGPGASLRPDHYTELSDRDIVLRLENNLKLRRQRAGDIAGALAVIERMVVLAPDHGVLLGESGMMLLHLGHADAALARFQQALAVTRSDQQRQLLGTLIRRLTDGKG